MNIRMRLRSIACIAILLLGCACQAADRTYAIRGSLREAAYEKVSLSMAKSQPPQFDLMLVREMPTPGWKIEVDALDIDEKDRRIVVRITEHRPGGMVAQVMTPTKLTVPLGELTPGSYFVEIWVRRGKKGTFAPTAALVLLTN
jgi:hypothetical protein